MEVERTQAWHGGPSCPRVWVSFVLVAAALAAGGCSAGASETESSQSPTLSHAGSTGSLPASSPPPSGDPLSRSQLIARADAICRGLDTKLATVNPASLSMHEIARFAPPRAVLERTAVAELSKLMPPASITRDWRQVIAYRSTLTNELFKLGSDAKANDAAGIRALAVSKKLVHQKLLTVATRDGFKYCSRVG